MELGQHKRSTIATDMHAYFCDPQNPWQRGANENSTDCSGDYFPKGSSLFAIAHH